nr:Spore coat protein U [Psychrobacter sp.]
MTVFHYGYRLLLLPIILCSALWLTPTNAQAALSVTCTANMSNVNLGSIILENSESASTTGTLSYSCDNSGSTAGYLAVCMAVNGGSHDNDDINPRHMLSKDKKEKLAFDMKLSTGQIWGDREEKNGIEYSSKTIYIAAGQKNITGEETITIFLVSGEGNLKAPPGVYDSNFSGASTALKVYTSPNNFTVNCTKKEERGTIQFPFTVQATVTSGCFISATADINLGSYAVGATNITGSNNAVSVTCQKEVNYNIGLSPSNGDKYGAGAMTSKNGNLDTIPYQLQSDASGKPWGNNGTTYGSLTNGVTGKGNGLPKAHTVYVNVPLADVRPDTYSDIVNVTVYF